MEILLLLLALKVVFICNMAYLLVRKLYFKSEIPRQNNTDRW